MKKTVFITGSTSGIGLAIAKIFAGQGHSIVFNGLEADGENIAARVASEFGIEHLFFNTNVMDLTALRASVDQSIAHFGAIDILVNNAGIQFVSPIEEFPEEKFDQIMAINLKAAFMLSKWVWPKMKERRFGRIVNISSAHGLVASENKSAYVCSKHALIGLTKTLALEGGAWGITCNAICPGYVHTPIIEKQIPEQMKLHHMTESEVISNIMLHKHAVKEFVPVSLIAEACLWLCREESAAVTGIALPLEAGWTVS